MLSEKALQRYAFLSNLQTFLLRNII